MGSEYISGVFEHKREVAHYMQIVLTDLMRRAIIHDNSKFSPEEREDFERVTPLLRTCAYGSEAYKAAVKELGPALDHHYQENDHHPAHFEAGINSMTLIELLEMICDWMAAMKREQNGDIQRSLDFNRERFKIESQLFAVLKNTVNQLIIEEEGTTHSGRTGSI